MAVMHLHWLHLHRVPPPLPPGKQKRSPLSVCDDSSFNALAVEQQGKFLLVGVGPRKKGRMRAQYVGYGYG